MPQTHTPKTKQQYSIKRPDLASVIICLTFQFFFWVTQKVTWVSGLFEYTWQAIIGQKIIKGFFLSDKNTVLHDGTALWQLSGDRNTFSAYKNAEKKQNFQRGKKIPFMQSVTTSLYLKFLWADSNPLVSLVRIHLIHQSIILSRDTEQTRGRRNRATTLPRPRSRFWQFFEKKN